MSYTSLASVPMMAWLQQNRLLRLHCATLNGVDIDHSTTRSKWKKGHSQRKKQRRTGCLRRDCRHTVTPQRLSEKGTRLPQQHVTEDASTSGVAETSGKRCSAGLCRDTKPKSPQRQRRKIRLPRQRVRNDAATSKANSYTFHSTLKHPSRCTGRKNHHDVRNLSAARRLAASDAGSQSNRTSKHVASSRAGALCQGVGWSLRVGKR